MHVLLKPAEINMVKNSKQTSIIGKTSSLMPIGPSYRFTSWSIVYMMLAWSFAWVILFPQTFLWEVWEYTLCFCDIILRLNGFQYQYDVHSYPSESFDCLLIFYYISDFFPLIMQYCNWLYLVYVTGFPLGWNYTCKRACQVFDPYYKQVQIYWPGKHIT